MRRILLAGVCLFINSYGVFAQKGTLGVGIATPNPNAALHVESPTGNQGFMMPRMSTEQRFAPGFTGALSDVDKGLMVFDTDLNTIFIWNGFTWQNTGEVSGGVKLTYPYMDSVTSGTGTNDLFSIKYNANEPKRIFRIENHNATNGSSALSVYTTGTGLGAYFQAANPASTSSALYATTNSNAGGAVAPVAVYGESTGTGSLGGSFRVTNASNNFPALFAETLGTGVSIEAITSTGFSAIQGKATGGVSNGVSGISNSPETGSYAVLGSNSGGGPAGVFSISNNTNLSTSLESTTLGTGMAAKFSINNAASTSPAMLVESNAAGRTAVFRKTNTTGAQPAIFVDSRGGHGIWADHNSATGYAAIIQTINTANTTAGMLVESIGTGPSVWALKSTDAVSGDAIRAENLVANGSAASFATDNATNNNATVSSTTTGGGNAGYFFNSNTSSGAATLFTETTGTGAALQAQTSSGFAAIYGRRDGATNGNAGLFEIMNSANTYPALQANTSGTGSAMNARHTGATGDALYAEHAGGNGSAGNFRISNVANAASSIYAATNGTGAAVGASHDSDGVAFAIWRGGVKITSMDVTTSVIATRASAYRITSGGTSFSFGFSPTDGEVFMIYNETGSTITLTASGVNNTILSGEGMTFVVFPGGIIRGF